MHTGFYINLPIGAVVGGLLILLRADQLQQQPALSDHEGRAGRSASTPCSTSGAPMIRTLVSAQPVARCVAGVQQGYALGDVVGHWARGVGVCVCVGFFGAEGY